MWGRGVVLICYNMHMMLTKEELYNLRVCCVTVSKIKETSEQQMAYLLNLSAKLDKIMSEEYPEPSEEKTVDEDTLDKAKELLNK